MLGYIIERLSQQSYVDFLTQHIFQPLGLHGTGYDSNTPPLPSHADGYLAPGQHPVFIDMSEFYAAGALYSTVGDLYTWDRALQAHQILSADEQAVMFANHIPCPPGGCLTANDQGYGYGWFLAVQDGHPYDYHWGRVDGYLSSNGIYPHDDVFVVMLSNLETTDTWGISAKLGSIVLGLTP